MHAVDFQPAITHLPRSAETALKILNVDAAAALRLPARNTGSGDLLKSRHSKPLIWGITGGARRGVPLLGAVTWRLSMLQNIVDQRRLNPLLALPVIVVILAAAAGLGTLWGVELPGRVAATSAAPAQLAAAEELAREARANLVAAAAATDSDASRRKIEIAMAALAQHHERMVEEFKSTQNGAHYAYAAALLVCLLSLAGGTAYVLHVRRRILGPVALLGHVMNTMRQDFSFARRASAHGHPAVANMTGEFNELMAGIQASLLRVVAEVENVNTVAARVADAPQQIAAGLREQGELAAATAAAVGAMTAGINQVADNARAATEAALDSSRLSEQSGKTAREAAAEMARIADSVNQSAQLIETLSRRSSEISGIVQVIKDIAEQTNLLALNAAIEAARAGEQGRGFAVVADEVRKLAERTAGATTEISAMIEAIQSEINAAVKNLGAGNERVNQGVKLAEDVAGALATINGGVQSALARISDIAQATGGHGAASMQIAGNIERMVRMAGENADAMTRAVEDAREVEQAAAKLQSEAGRYAA